MVRRRRTMHSGKPERKRVAFVERTEAHKRCRDWNLRLVGEICDILRRARGDHTAACVEDGAFRLVDKLCETRHLRGCGHRLRMVCTE